MKNLTCVILFPLLVSCIFAEIGKELYSDSDEVVQSSGFSLSLPQDFLTDHVLVYVAIVVLLFIVQTAVLLLMGQPFIPQGALRCWYGDTAGPGNSQHLFDWYTFTHVVHGVLMYFATFWLPHPITVNYSYLMALVTAVGWEIVENTPCVIAQFRKSAVAAGYTGDTVINSFFDSVAMTVGFWASFLSPWWLVAGLTVLEEVVLGVVIRDNFIINVIQLTCSFKCISDWQAGNKREKEMEPVGQHAPEDHDHNT